jgi:two-component system, cell cycle sensor histidine kinase and response regulator CckA
MAEWRAQPEVERFRGLYVASTKVNHALAQSRSREELLQEVVRVLVESAGFAMAFVAWHDPTTHELQPVARFGDTGRYLDRIKIFADESPEGQGPGGTAFRTRAPYYSNDFLNDPRALPWRDAARESGWRSVGAIPIAIGGEPRGVLLVYSREIGFFGPREADLLECVATDLAFGLEHLDVEEQRREAVAALAANERRLKLAMDAGGIGTFDWDLSTGKVVLDGRLERLFGFDPGGFDGTYAGLERCIHRDDLPFVRAAMLNAKETRTPFTGEFRVVWPDESICWLSGRGEYSYSELGEPRRVHGAVADVSQLKRAERALRQSEERLRQAVLVSHIGIFDHDHRTDHIYFSPEERLIHGWDPDEPVTLSMHLERVHVDDRERIREAVQRAHNPAGDGLYDVEHRIVLPDGSIRWTSTRAQTFFAGEGAARRPVRTVGAVRDITEQKQAEAEQKRLQEQLFQAQKMESIGRLAGGVAHDFNNMLTVILGYAALAKSKSAPSDPQLKYLEEIEKAGDRSREIVQQLLGFCRRQIIAPKPANLNGLLADMQKTLARLIGERIELRFLPEPDLWTVLLDPSQVHQILLNLVVNARDAMPNGGRVTIATANVELSEGDTRMQVGSTPGQYVVVTVSDNGMGMSKETMAHVFEPFFTTKAPEKGTGLGLATVYGIVQQNGGFITVDSELGRGCTFKIYFPRTAHGDEPEIAAASSSASAGAGTILLVEDDELVRRVTTTALESIGYTPLVAASPEEALRLCRESGAEIRLMLTDVVMSGMTGVELRDQARTILPQIKTLFMSGYTSNVIAEHGVLNKGVHFIQKPFSIEELSQKIAETLGSE